MATSTAGGMDMSVREGSGWSTWDDGGTICGDEMTGGQGERVGGGHVNKEFHFGHAQVDDLRNIQVIRSGRQLYTWACRHHGEVPGPAERGQAGMSDQLGQSWLTVYQL